MLLTEPFLSIVGGGLAAALVTIGFSAYWDVRKQRTSEDWEFRRYQANQIHFAAVGLMDAFFSAKSEMLYLTSTLETLLTTLTQLSTQADQIVRQQGGPAMTVAELEQRKQQLLQPFQTFNQQQVTLRWNQYEQKAKENHAKAEAHLRGLKRLIPGELYNEFTALFAQLSAPFVWDLPHGKEKLRILEDALPTMLALREKLDRQLEIRLGRRTPTPGGRSPSFRGWQRWDLMLCPSSFIFASTLNSSLRGAPSTLLGRCSQHSRMR